MPTVIALVARRKIKATRTFWKDPRLFLCRGATVLRLTLRARIASLEFRERRRAYGGFSGCHAVLAVNNGLGLARRLRRSSIIDGCCGMEAEPPCNPATALISGLSGLRPGLKIDSAPGQHPSHVSISLLRTRRRATCPPPPTRRSGRSRASEVTAASTAERRCAPTGMIAPSV
jgi:hypothetical protein